jgi:D-alanine-D-alanine ligase
MTANIWKEDSIAKDKYLSHAQILNFMSLNNNRFVLLVGGRAAANNVSLISYFALRKEILSSPLERERLSSIYYITKEGKILLHDNQNLPDSEYDLMMNGKPIEWTEMIRRLTESRDYIFSLLHGKEGGDGCYQGVCQILDLRGNLGSVFSVSISRSKWVLSFLSPRLTQDLVICPDTWVLSSNPSDLEMSDVIRQLSGRPAIIKPNSLGNSLFIEFFSSLSLSQLKSQIEVIKPYDSEILIQEYIKGIEYSCGVLENNGKIQALPVAEVHVESNFFGQKEKENDLERILFRKDSTQLIERIKLASLKLFTALGIRNTCRFDFICSNGKIYFLEANPIPGLGEESIFPKMLKEVNLSRLDLVNICISNYNFHKSEGR